jgi:AraC-like DNA-binding protein
VTFSPALVASPSLAADPENLEHLLRECDLQLRRLQGGELSQRVRARLAKATGLMPTLEVVAQAEHVSKRTLMRHLAGEGQTYQGLLDEVRFERACWLLQQSDVTVETVANQLGYEDASNFGRTFKRWSGLTPSEFRRQLKMPHC